MAASQPSSKEILITQLNLHLNAKNDIAQTVVTQLENLGSVLSNPTTGHQSISFGRSKPSITVTVDDKNYILKNASDSGDNISKLTESVTISNAANEKLYVVARLMKSEHVKDTHDVGCVGPDTYTQEWVRKEIVINPMTKT